LLDEQLATDLQLEGPTSLLKIQWTNNELYEQADSKLVSDMSETYKFLMDFFFRSHQNANPVILIGPVNWSIRISRKLKYQSLPGLAAGKTELGWVEHKIVGMITKLQDRNYSCHVFNRIGYDNPNGDLDILHNLVKSYWFIENELLTPHDFPTSPNDKKCL